MYDSMYDYVKMESTNDSSSIFYVKYEMFMSSFSSPSAGNTDVGSVFGGIIKNIMGYLLFTWNVINVIATSSCWSSINSSPIQVYGLMIYVIFTHSAHVLEAIITCIIYRSTQVSDHKFRIGNLIALINNIVACIVSAVILGQSGTTGSLYVYSTVYIWVHCVIKCIWCYVTISEPGNLIGIFK
jgi:hypothetical protein